MADVMPSPTHRPRPLLGLRAQPGRLALALMRSPRPLYRHGWGRLLGHTFMLVAHRGRTTGRRRETVVMALTWDPETHEAVACSVWGETEWIRNLRAHPALEIGIGGETFTPQQRFLSDEDAIGVVTAFRERHPLRLRLFSTIFGWGDLRSEAAVRALVRGRPFVAFSRALGRSDPPA